MFDKQNDSGVSPVIGVILMVAVTVALVALVTVTVFDLGGDVSESPDATVQLEQANVDSNPTVNATLLRNENVDYLYLSDGTNEWGGDPDASPTQAGLASAGDVVSTEGQPEGESSDVDVSEGETVNVIAVMPDGNEEVLTSTDVE